MWYVLWTSTGSEEKSRQMILTNADPDLYTRCAIPYRLKRHYYKGKSHVVKLLLFPSYIFVETEKIKEFVSNTKWFPGFNVVLHIDDFYFPIYKHEEYILTDLIDEKDIIDISKGYIEGENVHITSGPLIGKEGYIKKINRRQGIAVLEMNLFNRTTEVSLGLELLEKKLLSD